MDEKHDEKLAELQSLYLTYLQNWLRNNAAASLQRQKMQTLYDAVAGKIKPNYSILLRCEKVLQILKPTSRAAVKLENGTKTKAAAAASSSSSTATTSSAAAAASSTTTATSAPAAAESSSRKPAEPAKTNAVKAPTPAASAKTTASKAVTTATGSEHVSKKEMSTKDGATSSSNSSRSRIEGTERSASDKSVASSKSSRSRWDQPSSDSVARPVKSEPSTSSKSSVDHGPQYRSIYSSSNRAHQSDRSADSKHRSDRSPDGADRRSSAHSDSRHSERRRDHSDRPSGDDHHRHHQRSEHRSDHRTSDNRPSDPRREHRHRSDRSEHSERSDRRRHSPESRHSDHRHSPERDHRSDRLTSGHRDRHEPRSRSRAASRPSTSASHYSERRSQGSPETISDSSSPSASASSGSRRASPAVAVGVHQPSSAHSHSQSRKSEVFRRLGDKVPPKSRADEQNLIIRIRTDAKPKEVAAKIPPLMSVPIQLQPLSRTELAAIRSDNDARFGRCEPSTVASTSVEMHDLMRQRESIRLEVEQLEQKQREQKQREQKQREQKQREQEKQTPVVSVAPPVISLLSEPSSPSERLISLAPKPQPATPSTASASLSTELSMFSLVQKAMAAVDRLAAPPPPPPPLPATVNSSRPAAEPAAAVVAAAIRTISPTTLRAVQSALDSAEANATQQPQPPQPQPVAQQMLHSVPPPQIPAYAQSRPLLPQPALLPTPQPMHFTPFTAGYAPAPMQPPLLPSPGVGLLPNPQPLQPPSQSQAPPLMSFYSGQPPPVCGFQGSVSALPLPQPVPPPLQLPPPVSAPLLAAAEERLALKYNPRPRAPSSTPELASGTSRDPRTAAAARNGGSSNPTNPWMSAAAAVAAGWPAEAAHRSSLMDGAATSAKAPQTYGDYRRARAELDQQQQRAKHQSETNRSDGNQSRVRSTERPLSATSTSTTGRRSNTPLPSGPAAAAAADSDPDDAPNDQTTSSSPAIQPNSATAPARSKLDAIYSGGGHYGGQIAESVQQINAKIAANFKIPKKTTASVAAKEPPSPVEQPTPPPVSIPSTKRVDPRLAAAKAKRRIRKLSSSSSSEAEPDQPPANRAQSPPAKPQQTPAPAAAVQSTPADSSDDVTSSSNTATANSTAPTASAVAGGDLSQEYLLAMLSKMVDQSKFAHIQQIINEGASTSSTTAATAPAAQALPDSIDVPSLDDAAADSEVASMAISRPASPTTTTPTTRTPNPNRKRMNELDKLYFDIDGMYMRNDVLRATGRRTCTLPKPATAPVTPSSASSQPKRNGGRKSAKLHKSDTEESEAESSEEEQEEVEKAVVTPSPPKRILKRRNTVCVERSDADDHLSTTAASAGSPHTLAKSPRRRRRISTASEDQQPLAKAAKLRAQTPTPTALAARSQKTARKSTTKNASTLLASDERLARLHGIADCRVRLQRMTPAQIARAIAASKAKKRSASTAAASASVLSQLEALILKNTNRLMYATNAELNTACLLCDFIAVPNAPASRNLIYHYTNEHRSAENYLARLPPDFRSRLARLQPAQLMAHNKLRQSCLFCDQQHDWAYENWLGHLSLHTGEYLYECGACGTLNPGSRHCCPLKTNAHRRVVAQMDGAQLRLYVCTLCNWAQFGRDRVERHLVNQHARAVAEVADKMLVVNCLRPPPDGVWNKRRRLQVAAALKTEAVAEVVAKSEEPEREDGKVEQGSDSEAAVSKAKRAKKEVPKMVRKRGRPPKTRPIVESSSSSENEPEEEEAAGPASAPEPPAPAAAATSSSPAKSMAERLSERFKRQDSQQAAEPVQIELRTPAIDAAVDPSELEPPQSSALNRRPVADKILVARPPTSPAASGSKRPALVDPPATPPRSKSICLPELQIKESPVAAVSSDKQTEDEAGEEEEDDEWEDCSDDDCVEVVEATAEVVEAKAEVVEAKAEAASPSAAAPAPVVAPVAVPKAELVVKSSPASVATNDSPVASKESPVAAKEPPAPAKDSLAMLCEELMSDNSDADEGSPVVAPAPVSSVSSPSSLLLSRVASLAKITPNPPSQTTAPNAGSRQLPVGVIPLPVVAAPAAAPKPVRTFDIPARIKTIVRIDNIGYSQMNSASQAAFCCLMNKCGFESPMMYQMSAHLQQHAANNWSGYCFMCDKQIHPVGSYSLTFELKHMNSVHIINDKPQQRPTISVRRLPGDQLSANEQLQQQQQQQQQLQNQSQRQPRVPSNFLQISNVESLVSRQQQSPAQTPPTQPPQPAKPMFVISSVTGAAAPAQAPQIVSLASASTRSLRPWLQAADERNGRKTNAAYHAQMQLSSLTCLYKCMAPNCDFTANKADFMLAHLRLHDTIRQSTASSPAATAGAATTAAARLWLECSYCDWSAASEEALVRHVGSEHATSIFQCTKCFYRSCTAANVTAHQRELHRLEAGSEMVLVCAGSTRQLRQELPQIDAGRRLHVPQLLCDKNACKQRFYTIEAYQQHLHQSHPDGIICSICSRGLALKDILQHNLIYHQLGRYQCVHCPFGTNSEQAMRSHLWRRHPNRLLYVMCRVRRDSVHSKQFKPQPTDSLDDTALVYVGQIVDKSCFRKLANKGNKDNSPTLLSPPSVAGPSSAQPQPPASASTSAAGRPQLEIIGVNSISVEAFKATSPESLIHDVSQHSLSMEQIINLAEVETYFAALPVAHTVAAKAASVPPPVVAQRVVATAAAATTSSTSSAAQASPSPTPAPSPPAPPPKPPTPAAATAAAAAPSRFPYFPTPSSSSPAATPPPRHTDLALQEIHAAALWLTAETGKQGRDLYQCAQPGCTANTEDAMALNVHLLKHIGDCGAGGQPVQFQCRHCQAPPSAQIQGLMRHLQTHGRHLFLCYFCDYTGPSSGEMAKHMRETHKRNDSVLHLLDARRKGQPDCVVVGCPKTVRAADMYGFGLRLLERQRRVASKKVYWPAEVDELPKQSILAKSVGCAQCGKYESKVRTNLVRHLQACTGQWPPAAAEGEEATVAADPVNPVPCLEGGAAGGAMHADRMRNLACSSMEVGGGGGGGGAEAKAEDGTAAEESGSTDATMDSTLVISLFVPEKDRFVCNAPGCRYLTVNASMLHRHLATLHANESNWRCPHCFINLGTGNADHIIDHLRTHEKRLYKCRKCSFTSTVRLPVESHAKSVHATTAPNPVPEAVAIAGPSAGTSATQSVAVASAKPPNQPDPEAELTPSKMWHCTLCSEMFLCRALVAKHVKETHSIMSQYQCEVCKMQTNYRNQMELHMTSKHAGSDYCEVKYFYERVSIAVQPEETTPIWRRNDPDKVKNIRGILVDDEEEEPPLSPQNKRPLSVKSTHSMKVFGGDDSEMHEDVDVEHMNDPAAAAKLSLTSYVTVKNKRVGTKLKISNSTSKKPRKSGIEPSKATTSDSIVVKKESIPSYIFLCKYCTRRFATSAEVFTHWEARHKYRNLGQQKLINEDEPFRYQIDYYLRCIEKNCKASRILQRSWRIHSAQFHPTGPTCLVEMNNTAQCGICSYSNADQSQMQAHFREAHAEPMVSSATLLDLPLVPIAASYLPELLLGGQQARINCLSCAETLATRADFDRHHSASHPGVPPLMKILPEAPRFGCSICSLTADTEQAIVQHLQHHNMYKFHKKYQCLHCDVAFGTKISVRDHCIGAHGLNTSEWRLTPIEGRLEVYGRIKVIFPNGLVVCKEDVKSTEWGDMGAVICELMDIESTELAENQFANSCNAPAVRASPSGIKNRRKTMR